MEISKMLTINTAHVSKQTLEFLNDSSANIVAYPKFDYGFFVFTDPFAVNESLIPDDLVRCIKIAQSCGCDWMCLDRDGQIEPSIPVEQEISTHDTNLSVNGDHWGRIKEYHQDRANDRWMFTLDKPDTNYDVIISIPFSSIKSFSSCGNIRITTK